MLDVNTGRFSGMGSPPPTPPTAAFAPAPRGSVKVVRPLPDTIDVRVGRRRSLFALLKDLGMSVGASAVGAAFVTFLGKMGVEFFVRVPFAQLATFALLVFALLLVSLVQSVVRAHFARVTFRITPAHLSVTVADRFAAPREFTWRRDAVFEVRRASVVDGMELHVRLRRAPPCKLLRGRPRTQIDDAAAAVSAALAEIPPAAFPESPPDAGLTYAAPGEPYEIDIRSTPDGVTIVVPRAGDRAMLTGFGPWVVGLCVLVMIPVVVLIGPRLPPGTRRSPPPILIPVFVSIVAVLGVSSALLKRWRGGQPLIIEVTARDVWIDHPALPLRRRTWRRDVVIDVRIDGHKDKNDKTTDYFVRMTARNRRPIKFCQDRDTTEMRRVVTVLRHALSLPPLGDTDFPPGTA
jgi:hypothetical protein